MSKMLVLSVLLVVTTAQAGLLPATGAYVAPYASTYHAQHIDHAVAYPVGHTSLTVSAPRKIAYAASPTLTGAPLGFASPAHPVGFAPHLHSPVAITTPANLAYSAYAYAPLTYATHPYTAATPYYF